MSAQAIGRTVIADAGAAASDQLTASPVGGGATSNSGHVVGAGVQLRLQAALLTVIAAWAEGTLGAVDTSSRHASRVWSGEGLCMLLHAASCRRYYYSVDRSSRRA